MSAQIYEQLHQVALAMQSQQEWAKSQTDAIKMAIKALTELKDKMDGLEAENSSLRAQLRALRQRIDALENR